MARYVLYHIAQIVVRKYEKHDSLLIIDSASYMHIWFFYILVSIVKPIVNYIDQISKNGISVLADMGSFFHHNRLDYLIQSETSLPRRSKVVVKQNDSIFRIKMILTGGFLRIQE